MTVEGDRQHTMGTGVDSGAAMPLRHQVVLESIRSANGASVVFVAL